MLFSFTRRKPATAPTFVVFTAIIVPWLFITAHIPSIPDSPPSRSPLERDRHAFATLLTSSTASYTLSACILSHQLLRSPNTITPLPLLILVTPGVPEHHLQLLLSKGATLIPVPYLEPPFWISTGVTRWKDQFTKLRLWSLHEDWDRILYLDADTLLNPNASTRLHEIFTADLAVNSYLSMRVRRGGGGLTPPDNYVFAARTNYEFFGQRAHSTDPHPTDGPAFSAGFFLLKPCPRMFRYLVGLLRTVPLWMSWRWEQQEQALLNHAFRRNGGGAMPWKEVGDKWSATWPNHGDREHGVVTWHEKLWSVGEEDMRAVWERVREESGCVLEEA